MEALSSSRLHIAYYLLRPPACCAMRLGVLSRRVAQIVGTFCCLFRPLAVRRPPPSNATYGARLSPGGRRRTPNLPKDANAVCEYEWRSSACSTHVARSSFNCIIAFCPQGICSQAWHLCHVSADNHFLNSVSSSYSARQWRMEEEDKEELCRFSTIPESGRC